MLKLFFHKKKVKRKKNIYNENYLRKQGSLSLHKDICASKQAKKILNFIYIQTQQPSPESTIETLEKGMKYVKS